MYQLILLIFQNMNLHQEIHILYVYLNIVNILLFTQKDETLDNIHLRRVL